MCKVFESLSRAVTVLVNGMRGPYPVGERLMSGWLAPIMFYRFYCREHGWVDNYKWGFKERLVCLKCFEKRSEWIRRMGFDR